MEKLFDVVNKEISLKEEDKLFLKSVFKPFKAAKAEALIKKGVTADKLYFIVKGVVRVYFISEEGEELTSDIIVSRNFATSFESFRKAIPSNAIVETVTNCELLVISKEDYLELFNKVNNWQRFCNSVYENHLIRSSKRIHALKNMEAKERYLNLLVHNKEAVENTPIKHLASYLGVKPQSLSRIRGLL